MSLVGRSERKATERFPVTLVLAGFWLFALFTLPFIALGVQVDPLASAQAEILLSLLVGGIVLLLVSSIVFTKGFALIAPRRIYSALNGTQAIIVAAGFLAIAVWQLYINQVYFGVVLAGINTQSAFWFKSDTGIAEDTFFGAVAVFLYLTARYFKLDVPTSFILVLSIVAPFFALYHVFVAQILPIQQQTGFFIFVTGARIALTGVLLGTMLTSTKYGKTLQAGSLAAPVGIHVLWNNLT